MGLRPTPPHENGLPSPRVGGTEHVGGPYRYRESGHKLTGELPAYRRVMQHRGHKKAVVAVAHAMLVTVYHLLARGTTYQEPGTDYYDRRHAERVRRRAIQTLERQGYRVMVEPAA